MMAINSYIDFSWVCPSFDGTANFSTVCLKSGRKYVMEALTLITPISVIKPFKQRWGKGVLCWGLPSKRKQMASLQK